MTKSWKAGRILRLNLLFQQANERFAKELNVVRTPTYILFDARGQEVKRWEGQLPPLAELPSE
jgi:hypothetical protein